MSSGTLTRTGRPAPPRRTTAGGAGETRRRSAPPAGPRMDPRFDERRREVAHGRSVRRRRRLGIVAGGVALVAGAFGLSRSAALDVDAVHVRGASGDRSAQVETASGVRLGDALVSLDLHRVESRVESLAWVADAQATRSWRGTVTVTVAERSPVAVAGRAGAAVLLDAEGRSLGPAGSADLPALEAPAPAVGAFIAPRQRMALRVLAGLPPELRGQVTAAKLDGDGVELTLDDGISVRFGDDHRLAAKAQALSALLDLPDRASVEQIDVRAASAPALTRSRGSGSLTDRSEGGA